jgi:hypothetical protein
MKWYEKKFSDFFNKWKKGDLFLKNSKGYFGEIEEFEVAENFEESTIKFLCYEYSGEVKEILLKEIRHFHAFNGPILNIGKYLNILKLGETSYLKVIDGGKSEVVKENEDKIQKGIAGKEEIADKTLAEESGGKIICIAFGLEFFTTEKTAEVLQRDIKKLLFSKLEEIPLLSIDDQAPVDLTPTFSWWYTRFFRSFGRSGGKHLVRKRLLKSTDSNKESEEKVKI